MVYITEHAVARLMERNNMEKAKAFWMIKNKLSPQEKKIKDGLKFISQLRIDIGDDMIAICVLNRSDVKVVTVRKKKYL